VENAELCRNSGKGVDANSAGKENTIGGINHD